MNFARLAVLIIAVGAAAGAVLLFLNGRAPEPQAPNAPVVVQAPVTTDDVLVAAQDLTLGTSTTATDFAWQPWPKTSISDVMIKKSDNDKVVADLAGSIVRSNIFKGEPIRRERLIKASSGFLSAVLPSGMRAVAIGIDAQGSTSAGGFVLPNDRVDVIRTVRAGGNATPDNFVSETLLTNVKVLAIGQNIQDKNGAPTQVGTTATLELDPVQTETVILAQRTGQLSLALRSLQDAAQVGAVNTAEGKTTVIRYGIEADAASR
jgi:pilus assembly protein CpaB